MYYFKLYGKFIAACLKSRAEYRFSFFMDIFVQILGYFLTYLGIWVLMSKFQTIHGWGFYEVVFLYSFNLLSYGLCGAFFWEPMHELEGLIQRGEFDGILVKPINPFFHLLSRYFAHPAIGHITLSSIVFYICFIKLNLEVTLTSSLCFLTLIFGAWLIQASIMVMAGSLNFWFVKSSGVVDTMIYGLREFINYPIVIYNKAVQVFLTFIIPYAFVNYYPVQYFLDKSDGIQVHRYLWIGTPLIGIIMAIIAYLLFNFGINHYQSTGS